MPVLTMHSYWPSRPIIFIIIFYNNLSFCWHQESERRKAKPEAEATQNVGYEFNQIDLRLIDCF